MSLKDYKPEEIKEMAMVEIAYEIMLEEKQPFVYTDLVKLVAEIKEMSREEVMERISFLYTDLNTDGRFIALGDNRWGLKSWYPFEQSEEEITQTVRRKKPKAVDFEDELLDEDFEEEEIEDEFEDLEDELDELANEEDEDFEEIDEFDEDEEVEEDTDLEDELEEDEDDDLL